MLREIVKKLKKVIYILPGFLLWASFPPMGEATDCLFALAPLLWFARRNAAFATAKVWFSNGLFFWLATLAWMPAIVKNGGPLALVILGWFLLAIYCALYFGLSGWFTARYWQWVRGDVMTRPRGYAWRLVGLFLVEPIVWAGFELVRSRLMGGFAWNQLGVAPVNCGFGAPACLGGVYLLSMLVVLVNGTLASVADRIWSAQKFAIPAWLRTIETAVPILAIFAIFSFANQQIAKTETDKTREISVAMIQRNFPNVFRSSQVEEDPHEIYARLFALVAPLKPELVIAPESALVEFGSIGSARARAWMMWAREKTGAAAVIAGGERQTDGQLYNSAWLVAGEHNDVYDKVHLVPFGEFIPFDKKFPALKKFAPVGSCTPGELKLLSFGDVHAGVAICFEDTDSAQMRLLAKKGANLLVFITNDSWFSQSNEAHQHAWQARARALETGLSIVRVGNSGVTGTMARDGRVTWLADAHGRLLVDCAASMVERVKIPLREFSPPPYVVWGDAPLFCAFLATIFAIVILAIIRRSLYRLSH